MMDEVQERYDRNPGRVKTGEKETTEECSPVLLTLHLIINEVKYAMLIIKL